MGKVRAKKVYKNPNRFFEICLSSLSKEAEEKSWKVATVYAKALASLRKYPLKLSSGKECKILNGFGTSICDLLDEKLRNFAEQYSLPIPEALALANSLTPDELLDQIKTKNLGASILMPTLNHKPKSYSKASKLPNQPPPLSYPLLSRKSPQSFLSLSPGNEDVLDNQLERDTVPSSYLAGNSYEVVLIVDIRETFGMAKLKQNMKKHSLNWEARSLPVGDFLWIARPYGVSEEEVVVGLVLERKRADDLASSIVDGRFTEQKGRMQKLGFRTICIFEECKAMHNLRISYETLLKAMVNAQIIDGCDFVTCTCSDDCAGYLASLTRLLSSRSKYDCAVFSDGRRPPDPRADRGRLWGIPWTEYTSLGKKSPNLPLREQFGRQLLQIHSVTGSKAQAIVQLFPTPRSLFETYDAFAREEEKMSMLLRYAHSSSLKSINKKVSEMIYYLYNTM